MNGKTTQKREKNLIILLSGFCAYIFLSSTFQNITLCYDLGKDGTDTFVWQMVPQSVGLLLMIFCAALIFGILRNMWRKQVFVRENARSVQLIGLVVMVYGFFLAIWEAVSPVETAAGFMRNLFLLLGAFFVLVGCVFKAGVSMKEEQDLTI